MRLNRHHRASTTAPDPVATPTAPALRLVPLDPALAAERRMKAAGGPQDTAVQRCSCGYVFEAAVTTTVVCPHCSTPLAW